MGQGLATWRAAGLEPITLHECCHTLASLLIAAANAKAIQEFLGHASIQMTFDRCGHLMPGSRDQARARVDAYLAGFPLCENPIECERPECSLRP